jgi:hypothetical protein
MSETKYGMPPPRSRKEFEHNIYLLAEDTIRKINSGSEYKMFYGQHTPILKR